MWHFYSFEDLNNEWESENQSVANHGASPWGGQGYVSVHKPTASCLSQIRETLSTGGGRWGLDSSDERKGSGESYSDKTKEKAHEKCKGKK